MPCNYKTLSTLYLLNPKFEFCSLPYWGHRYIFLPSGGLWLNSNWDVGLGDVRLGDVRLGNVGFGDLRIGEPRLGEVGLVDLRIWEMRIRDVRLGDVRRFRVSTRPRVPASTSLSPTSPSSTSLSRTTPSPTSLSPTSPSPTSPSLRVPRSSSQVSKAHFLESQSSRPRPTLSHSRPGGHNCTSGTLGMHSIMVNFTGIARIVKDMKSPFVCITYLIGEQRFSISITTRKLCTVQFHQLGTKVPSTYCFKNRHHPPIKY